MNYYSNNKISTIEDVSQPVIDHPWNVSYIQFPDKAHNNLERCKECMLKFDIHRLTRLSPGVFICPFCKKGAA